VSETGAPRRLQITGLHHLTMLVASAERSASFYRDLLGIPLVERTTNADDPNAQHLMFGIGGTMVTVMEYPDLEQGFVGRGSTHHFALGVESDEELVGWREYLRSRGVDCTEIHDRGPFRSLYVRDPDGHLVEIATPIVREQAPGTAYADYAAAAATAVEDPDADTAERQRP
jgi:catechol 2,3-dioxygenase-like lactoylglutathione lyase family enzyme